MEKWYRKTDNTSIYFICHGTRKFAVDRH
jgi:hypothetical protein